MVFDSDILNWPIELASGIQNRWMRAILTFISVIIWSVPILLIFVTPLIVWNAFTGE